jgi:uncharacterized membrane protein
MPRHQVSLSNEMEKLAQPVPTVQVHRSTLQAKLNDMEITDNCAFISCICNHILEMDLLWLCYAQLAQSFRTASKLFPHI